MPPSCRTTRSLPRKPSANDRRLAFGVVGDDLLAAAGDGDRAVPSGPNAWPSPFFVSATNSVTLPSSPILYVLLFGHVVEEDFALAR